ncbi:MAG: DUF6431 domain-containing protein [Pseudanabaena sp. ELA748]
MQVPVYQDDSASPSENWVCPICDGKCEPIKYGAYWRNAIEISGDKHRIRIQRYLCKNKGGTFSWLPERLIPYQAPCLPLAENLWKQILTANQSQKETLAEIMAGFPESPIANWEYSRLQDLLQNLEAAMAKMTIFGQQTFSSLGDFLRYCQEFTYNGRRGLLAIAQSFYTQHQRFLFGTPSQHR